VDVNEKKLAHERYIRDAFTLPTFAQLGFLYGSFETNCQYIDEEIDNVTNSEPFALVHRFRALHVLFRLTANIETLLAMVYILSQKQLEDFGRIMLRYDQNMIDQVINDIADAKIEQAYRVFGFPEPKGLDVSKDDRKFLHELFQLVAEEYNMILLQLCKFYQNHRSAYNKLKHGLMFALTEMETGQNVVKAVVTYHRYDKKNFFRLADCYRPPRNPSPPGMDWFNLVSYLPQERHILEKYKYVNAMVWKLAKRLIRNLFDLGSNCGRDYLPEGVDDVLQSRNMLRELDRYKEIKNRMAPKMLSLSIEQEFVHNLREEASKKTTEHWNTNLISNTHMCIQKISR